MRGKKLALSTLFVAMLTIPTILGAIPLKVVTPVGVVSTEVSEAEARNRNTSANRPRSLQARNSGANRVQSFSSNRTSYTVNVRQSTNRADIRIGIREGQQHRWRIDTRNNNGNWRNGSYNSWRARATRNINRDVRVNVSQGQERRLRVQIRDVNRNVRTITVNVRRASGNTAGDNLRANAGIFSGSFNFNHTLVIPYNRTAATQVGMRAEQERGQARNRVRMQNANGQWGTWSSWSSYTRGQSNRNVGTIPQGRQAQVQFMIRGAFSNMSNSPTRTRIHTVNVIRPQSQINDKWDVFTRLHVVLRGDARNVSVAPNRPFNPNIFEYDVRVPAAAGPFFRSDIRFTHLNYVNPHLLNFEIREDHPLGGWQPWVRLLHPGGIPAIVATSGHPCRGFARFQLRYIPTGEVRTYTFDLVR